MRGRLMLVLALAAANAHGQGTLPPGIRYYFSENLGDSFCGRQPDVRCSIVECDARGAGCACPRVLPGGLKQPLNEEQCRRASLLFPHLPPPRTPQPTVPNTLGKADRQKSGATTASPAAAAGKQEKPAQTSSMAAAEKLSDDEVCQPKGSSGVGTKKSPTRCLYICGPHEVCIELDPPATTCPGEKGPMSPARWKTLKQLRRCQSR